MSTHTQLTGIQPEVFTSLFRHHPNGVAVVAAETPDGPVGLTATSVVSVCADPPILAFSVRHAASAQPALSQAPTLTVHFLDTTHAHLSDRFATSGIDRFAGLAWHPLPTGEPRLPEVGTWVRAEVVQQVLAGHSTVFVLHALQAEVSPAREPLIYHDHAYHRLGRHSRLSQR